MIIGSSFAVKKFNKIAREGGETGIVLEEGYVMRRATYGHTSMNFTYMGFAMYRLFKIVDGKEKPLGLWAAPIKCVHEWYVLVCETRNGLQDLIKEWRRLNPDDARERVRGDLLGRGDRAHQEGGGQHRPHLLERPARIRAGDGGAHPGGLRDAGEHGEGA